MVFSAIGLSATQAACGASLAAYPYSDTQYMVGSIRRHVINKTETLLDIARLYNLGFNEIQDLYPDWDPWLPPHGVEIKIPSQWILPEIVANAILINLAELRLYYFSGTNGSVMTFPIGIGDPKFPTPEGNFRISVKIESPTWTVPLSLRNQYSVWTVPAGADNPLGQYWLGLDDSAYGIHGTNFPWSVGRTATQGCIRLYPEDIRRLFALAQVGTPVKIIYEPVKISKQSGKVFVEIHKDVYGIVGDLPSYALDRLHQKKVFDLVDLAKLHGALGRCDGMPVDVTRFSVSGQNPLDRIAENG